MKPSPIKPFDQFLTEKKKQARKCWVCVSEHRAEIERIRAEGHGPKAISDWLQASGYDDVTSPKIYGHFASNHHLDK